MTETRPVGTRFRAVDAGRTMTAITAHGTGVGHNSARQVPRRAPPCVRSNAHPTCPTTTLRVVRTVQGIHAMGTGTGTGAVRIMDVAYVPRNVKRVTDCPPVCLVAAGQPHDVFLLVVCSLPQDRHSRHHGTENSKLSRSKMSSSLPALHDTRGRCVLRSWLCLIQASGHWHDMGSFVGFGVAVCRSTNGGPSNSRMNHTHGSQRRRQHQRTSLW